MEVKVCRGCKKIFQYIAGPQLCPRCKQLEEDMFQKVKEYLRQNPGASLIEVSKETEVSAGLIEKFLRQGRLQVTADSPIQLTCERCGKKITTGSYCNGCKNEITNELNEVKKSFVTSSEHHDDAGPRMRYLKSDRVK